MYGVCRVVGIMIKTMSMKEKQFVFDAAVQWPFAVVSPWDTAGLRYQKTENRDLMLRGSLFLPTTGECARAAGRAATDSVQLMARICRCLDARRRVKQSEDELTPRKGSILPIKLSVTELFMIFRCASISLVLCLSLIHI